MFYHRNIINPLKPEPRDNCQKNHICFKKTGTFIEASEKFEIKKNEYQFEYMSFRYIRHSFL